jgi:quercetin dioxygenase-like cupin family protein
VEFIYGAMPILVESSSYITYTPRQMTTRTQVVIFGLVLVFYLGCGRNPSDSANKEETPSAKEQPKPAKEGFILHAGQGEIFGNGIVAKLSPENGTESSILVEQTFPKGGSTTLHLHEQGDELFYVISGNGTATLGDKTEKIGPGDVIFVPRNAVHKVENLTYDDPLRVVFFMDRPELVDQFRAMHERETKTGRPLTAEEVSEIEQKFGGGKSVK